MYKLDEENKIRRQKSFIKRAREEFGKEPPYSAFLSADLIKKYPTAISIPTARIEAIISIDEDGNILY